VLHGRIRLGSIEFFVACYELICDAPFKIIIAPKIKSVLPEQDRTIAGWVSDKIRTGVFRQNAALGVAQENMRMLLIDAIN
jgi:hypothetical protein